MIRNHFLMICMLFCLPVGVLAADLKMQLDVRVDTEKRLLTGTARLQSMQGIKMRLFLGNIANLTLDGQVIGTTKERLNLNVPAGPGRVLTFETPANGKNGNYVDPQHIFLTGNWFPKPDGLAEYALSVAMPEGFLAVSEADRVDVRRNKKTNTFHFQFNHPVDGLSLAASKNYVLQKDKYKEIDIEAYFFTEDAHLAGDYLDFTKKYLAMYEKMLTPYPYRRFVVAENLFPTGYSMPTYTLLGKAVVHLPFITRTSLGHEILHQWFGNSVYIDHSRGNWAEGVTNYLADHHYADLKGEGAAYRKQIMVNYDAYVNDSNKMPVSGFSSRRNKAESAIGYGQSAMIFHYLRKMVGEETFFDSLRHFLTANRFRRAAWDDFQKSFEKTGPTDLTKFFVQGLKRDEIPGLTVKNQELVVDQGQLKLHFELIQNKEPFSLHLPIAIHSSAGKTIHNIEVNQSRETVNLVMNEMPTRVVIDEEYDLMRQLDPVEAPAVLAKIMGTDKLVVAMPPEQAEKYQPIIHALGVKDVTILAPGEMTFDQVKANSVVICGYQLPLVDMLFGRQPVYPDGVRLHVHENPYNRQEVILLLHVKNSDEAKAVRRKLSHYGKYSKLVFNGGKNFLKEQGETASGIPVMTRPVPKVVVPDKVATLDDLLPTLKEQRVIYVGEQHENYAHHMNQLIIIKNLHEAGEKLAVGMEMFQLPYQAALDDYLAGRIDERTFLQRSAYFEKWRFDYNLYKPIIDYLKKEKIPLVALNIEGHISRKVGRKGINSLANEEKEQLPSEMDFTDSRYRQDLHQVFDLHENQHHLKEFNYFLQAQLLWDETMAESAHRFLASHPDTKLVVLAGNGHLRYKYGIPARAHRRNGFPYAVIVQDEDPDPGIADFVLITERLKGKRAPRLGVGIEEKENAIYVASVMKDSPADKGGLKEGDKIIRFNHEDINSLVDLKFALFYTSMESTVTIQVDRKGKKMVKEITLFDLRHK